ncbi:hypothetical protein Tco_0752426 [Tanacetum coccineum]|uniref:Reverse transcriptase domain-containing protein n=1 Tax=Tanacetum coccineum TaxID=301880 RepID=A0ABQ4ZA11_9ASTR
MTNLTGMLSKFVNSNTASTSGSGTLPSNTITNPKVDLKGMTTRSGALGPTIPTTTSSPPKVVERKTEVTKDTVPLTNNGSTKDVQPPVVQVQPQVPNSEPVVAPVSAPMPNLKPSIPYPSRLVDFDADPRVPLILRKSFLKTGRALIDVYKEVLGFSDVIASGNPTLYYDLIVSTSSPPLHSHSHSFRDSDFLLEEVDAFPRSEE